MPRDQGSRDRGRSLLRSVSLEVRRASARAAARAPARVAAQISWYEREGRRRGEQRPPVLAAALSDGWGELLLYFMAPLSL